jgi:hypothetical protein
LTENPKRSSFYLYFWKGVAHYYHVVVGEEQNPDAAWHYPDPKDAAAEIRDHIAFWNGVEVVESAQGVLPPCQRASCLHVPCQISFSLTPI